jgi:hypothetical protein
MTDPFTTSLLWLGAVLLFWCLLSYRDWRALREQERQQRLARARLMQVEALRRKAEYERERRRMVEDWADAVERRKWVRALMGTYTSPVDEMRDWR